MTDLSHDAPDLLHKNPETDDDIADPFIDLYRQARRCFCHEVLEYSAFDSVWDVATRPGWSPTIHNPIDYDGRLSKLVSRSWDEARPPVQQAAPFIETDPTLLDVHSGLAHTFDVREGRAMPERIALFNLRMWVTRGLRQFWDRRLTGELTALFGVQSNGVQLKGMAPKPLLEAHIRTSHDLSNKYSNSCADS